MSRFGSLGTQYFDNSGDPLVNGLVYFYESGTTTAKTTFADINQTVPNTNPVVLSASGRQPNVFFNGVAKAVLATSADVQIEVRDPVGDTGADNQFSPWIPSFSYSAEDIVIYDGGYYVSLTSGNINNIPSSSPSNWEVLADSIIEDQTVVGVNQVAIGSATTGLTGLDSTAKGALVVGTGGAVTALAVGANDRVPVADSAEAAGIRWAVIPGAVRDYQEFLSSGTWTQPDDVEFVYVEAIAGGAGGANEVGAGGCSGGSGGEFVCSFFQASTLGATETVTIGAGGLGGANGGDNAGNVGGNTTFGAHLTAIGGNGGPLDGNQQATIPRSVQAATTTDLFNLPFPQAGSGGDAANAGGNCIYGGAGGGGFTSAGGVSEFGGNGGAGNNTAATKGGNGTVPGGGGGASGNDGGGGDGASGRVRVWSW